MCDRAQVQFKWTCPHCGFENRHLATIDPRDISGRCEPIFAYCDVDEGGCDRMVAIKPRAVVQAEVFALERPGEQGKDTDAEGEARTDYADLLN